MEEITVDEANIDVVFNHLPLERETTGRKPTGKVGKWHLVLPTLKKAVVKKVLAILFYQVRHCPYPQGQHKFRERKT